MSVQREAPEIPMVRWGLHAGLGGHDLRAVTVNELAYSSFIISQPIVVLQSFVRGGQQPGSQPNKPMHQRPRSQIVSGRFAFQLSDGSPPDRNRANKKRRCNGAHRKGKSCQY